MHVSASASVCVYRKEITIVRKENVGKNEMNDYSEIKKNKALTLIMCVINTLHCKMGFYQCRNDKETAFL